jgi:hypothetical protein
MMVRHTARTLLIVACLLVLILPASCLSRARLAVARAQLGDAPAAASAETAYARMPRRLARWWPAQVGAARAAALAGRRDRAEASLETVAATGWAGAAAHELRVAICRSGGLCAPLAAAPWEPWRAGPPRGVEGRHLGQLRALGHLEAAERVPSSSGRSGRLALAVQELPGDPLLLASLIGSAPASASADTLAALEASNIGEACRWSPAYCVKTGEAFSRLTAAGVWPGGRTRVVLELMEVYAHAAVPAGALLAPFLSGLPLTPDAPAPVLGALPPRLPSTTPDLLAHGDFERWAGSRPEGWYLSDMSGDNRATASFIGSPDVVTRCQGAAAGRVDGVAVHRPSAGQESARAGFWYVDDVTGGSGDVPLVLGRTYAFGFCYRTRAVGVQGATILLSNTPVFGPSGEVPLPPTGDRWVRVLIVGTIAMRGASIRPLFRLWSEGTLWIDAVSLHDVTDGAGISPGTWFVPVNPDAMEEQ